MLQLIEWQGSFFFQFFHAFRHNSRVRDAKSEQSKDAAVPSRFRTVRDRMDDEKFHVRLEKSWEL
jgi:hypothetical protein